jgi:hypothetical protein
MPNYCLKCPFHAFAASERLTALAGVGALIAQAASESSPNPVNENGIPANKVVPIAPGLLEIHSSRKSWSDQLDLVIDRWDFNLVAHRNLEDLSPRQLQAAAKDRHSNPGRLSLLRPDSDRRYLCGSGENKETAGEEEASMANRLVDLHQ